MAARPRIQSVGHSQLADGDFCVVGGLIEEGLFVYQTFSMAVSGCMRGESGSVGGLLTVVSKSVLVWLLLAHVHAEQ